MPNLIIDEEKTYRQHPTGVRGIIVPTISYMSVESSETDIQLRMDRAFDILFSEMLGGHK